MNPDDEFAPFEQEWTDVQSPKEGDYLERIKVPGGWLYRSRTYGQYPNTNYAVTMTFVPFPAPRRGE